MKQIKLISGNPGLIPDYSRKPYFLKADQILANDFTLQKCSLTFSGSALLKEIKINFYSPANGFVLVPLPGSGPVKIDFPGLELKVVAEYNNTGQITFSYSEQN